MALRQCVAQLSTFRMVIRGYAAGANFLKDVPLRRRDGELVQLEELQNKAIVLYFSAGWCGHCRLFTPKLMKWYEEAARDENIEIIWVSRDREEKHQLEYHEKALPNVPYIPFGDRHISEFLTQYAVKTIPAARLVDSEGKVIEMEVRNRVQEEGQVDARKLAKEFRSLV